MRFSDEILEILACPRCKGPLKPAGDALECAHCELSYPVDDGLAILLTSRAQSTTRGQVGLPPKRVDDSSYT
jgi:uncharacterized protein YbaR (Trm112 family)